MHYVGKLLDGTVFDSSRDRNEAFSFKLGEGMVIKGWDKGVATMKKGEIAILTCAPDYAYGKRGSPPKIPADATLQFEVELLSWTDERDITDSNDGGILKKTLKEGEGWEKPKEDWKVKVNWIARLLDSSTNVASATPFEEKNNFEFVVGAEETILGIDIAVQKMKKGEKSLLNIKPQYAYGAQGNEALHVPANASVQYELELVDYEKEKDNWDMSVDEKFAAAEKKKNEGNTLYQQGKTARAMKKYKRGLDFFEYDNSLSEADKERAKKVIKVPCHLNTAACHIKDKDFKKAIESCGKVIELDHTNVKALFRRGSCWVEFEEYESAQRDLDKALELDPNNAEIKRELAKLKKKKQEQDKKDKQFYSTIFQKLAQQKETKAAATTATSATATTTETPAATTTTTTTTTEAPAITTEEAKQ